MGDDEPFWTGRRARLCGGRLLSAAPGGGTMCAARPCLVEPGPPGHHQRRDATAPQTRWERCGISEHRRAVDGERTSRRNHGEGPRTAASCTGYTHGSMDVAHHSAGASEYFAGQSVSRWPSASHSTRAARRPSFPGLRQIDDLDSSPTASVPRLVQRRSAHSSCLQQTASGLRRPSPLWGTNCIGLEGTRVLAFAWGYTIRPFLTAYRTISAVLWRFSFCIRFFRWVSTVDSPRSSKFATSLFERPSASN